MEELGAMYATLANGGEHSRLVFEAGEQGSERQATQRLLSPEAAYVTLEMLKANPRPDTGQPAFPPVAWKTGTSWGFRDAWTAGVFGRSVLVVWVGNFDGSPNPAFIGVQTAAPLFFSIVDSLRSQGLELAASAQIAPRGLSRVPVCAASGDLPNEHCKDKALTWFIPGKSPIKVSTLHRLVHVDPSTGRAACARGATTREEVFEYWSSDMLQLFAQAGMPRRVPPALPRCGAGGGSGGGEVQSRGDADVPQIVSPLRGASYVVRMAQGAGQAVPLVLKANAARQGTLYWFADAAFVGTSLAGKALEWTPQRAGRVVLSAVDEQGASDSRELTVEYLP
jgi:penicillin-binding protein 1C